MNDVDWEENEIIGRVNTSSGWVNLVAYSVAPKIAILEGYTITEAPLRLGYEDDELFLVVKSTQTINGIDIYAESVQAT